MKPKITNINQNSFDADVETFDVYLPHHEVVTIRSRSAVDEGILSRVGDFTKNVAIPKFLASIIVGPKPYTAEQIQAWPLRSKYYLMMKERILQYGSLVSWNHEFKDEDGSTYQDLEEDIAWADGDLKDPNYTPKRKGSIIPYPKGTLKMEHTTASGKKVRMEFLTGHGESMALAKPMVDIDINDRFFFRNIEILNEAGNWLKVSSLHMLSGKDTSELRKLVEREDPEFNLVVSLKHPKSGQFQDVSLFTINDFFFQ